MVHSTGAALSREEGQERCIKKASKRHGIWGEAGTRSCIGSGCIVCNILAHRLHLLLEVVVGGLRVRIVGVICRAGLRRVRLAAGIRGGGHFRGRCVACLHVCVS